MLPVTHGEAYTRLNILLYTLALVAATLLPVATGMAGWLYLIACLPLNACYIVMSWRLYRRYTPQLARQAFAWSILYLGLLFAALLADHYAALPILV